MSKSNAFIKSMGSITQKPVIQKALKYSNASSSFLTLIIKTVLDDNDAMFINSTVSEWLKARAGSKQKSQKKLGGSKN